MTSQLLGHHNVIIGIDKFPLPERNQMDDWVRIVILIRVATVSVLVPTPAEDVMITSPYSILNIAEFDTGNSPTCMSNQQLPPSYNGWSWIIKESSSLSQNFLSVDL